MQLCEFKLAMTADIRRIVLQSSAKSCNLDPMPTRLLKGNIDQLAPILTDIINTSLETGVVPADMKHALVAPILKKCGLDVNSLANYHTTSNLHFVSKTLECAVTLIPTASTTRSRAPTETQHGDGSGPNS